MTDGNCNPSVLLRELLEEIDLTIAPSDPLARYAEAIRERQRTDPSREIQIVDASRESLLRFTPYTGDPTLYGSISDAFRIAQDLFERGLDRQAYPRGLQVVVRGRGKRVMIEVDQPRSSGSDDEATRSDGP